MKTVKFYIAALLLIISGSAFAQNIKLKKGDVLVDDVVWLKYDGCGGWDRICSISNLQGEELIYMNLESVPGTNPEKKYWKVKFLGTQQTIEIEIKINGSLLKMFYNSKVVNPDGTLNEENVNRMVEKYGNSFSPKQSSSTQTIIIKEEPRKSGININIGG